MQGRHGQFEVKSGPVTTSISIAKQLSYYCITALHSEKLQNE